MKQRLSLLAGHGQLVLDGARAALADNWEVQVVNLVGRDDLGDVDSVSASPTNPLSIWMALRKFSPSHICMIGAVRLSDGDREGLAKFLRGKAPGGPRTSKRTSGDGALSQLSRLLEFSTGAKVVGIHEIVDGLLAPAGHIAGPRLNVAGLETAQFNMRLARQVGALDAGQSLVTCGGRIVAIEDIAGTDALIDRVAEYKRTGLAGDGSEPLVLTKCRKPGQSGAIDLPAIGPETVLRAAKAGVATIVVQSGHTLLISREEIVREADAANVSIVGVEADEQPDG